MKNLKLLGAASVALVLCLTSLASAQVRAVDKQTVTASASTVTELNNAGAMNVSFEYVITGSPATISIVLSGCKNGGTCEALDTYTTVANAIRPTSSALSKAYDYFTIVPSWTGGTNPAVTINTTLLGAGAGSSSGGGTVTAVTGSSGVSSSGGASPNLSLASPALFPGDSQHNSTNVDCYLLSGTPNAGWSLDPGGLQLDAGNCGAGDTSAIIGAGGLSISGSKAGMLDLSPGNGFVPSGAAGHSIVGDFGGSGMFGGSQNNGNPVTLAMGGENFAYAQDNTIASSSVDANGNPNFLTFSTTNLTINGGTTPLTMYIAGVRQQLNSNITIAITNIGSTATEQEQYVFAKQDTTANQLLAMVSADFERSSCAPTISKTKPTACGAPSSTNAQYWFDLSTGLMRRSTDGSTYTATPAILLGVFAVEGSGGTTGTVDAAATMPFRLSPQTVFKEFGDGSNQSGNATANVTRDGLFFYTNLMVAGGAAVIHSSIGSALTSNTPGFLASSQTPVLLVGNSSINANGQGLVGSAGTAGTCAAAGNGGLGGNGGGSGGASATNAGCKGGNSSVYWAIADQNGGGTAGTAGSPGTAGASGVSRTVGWTNNGALPFSGFDLGSYLGGTGSPGAAGAGIAAGGSGGKGGNSGGEVLVKAPSINITSGSSIAANGVSGVIGTTSTSSGGCGGGGGGGTAGFIGYFSVNGTTGITVTGATAVTTCSGLTPASSNGGAGADGNLIYRIMG